MSLTSYRAAPPRVNCRTELGPVAPFCLRCDASLGKRGRAAPPRVNFLSLRRRAEASLPWLSAQTLVPLRKQSFQGGKRRRPLALPQPYGFGESAPISELIWSMFLRTKKPAPKRLGRGFWISCIRYLNLVTLPTLKIWRRLTLPHLKMQYHQR